MSEPNLPRILIVDDEEAILETMSFTFMDLYEVFTSTDARKGLEILDEKSPIACVITDQRMPGMTGVEFLGMDQGLNELIRHVARTQGDSPSHQGE